MKPSDEVLAHYQLIEERLRLKAGAGQLELARTLLDPVPKHVEHANRVCPARLGDARSLPFADASSDAALLLGPLYHLTTLGDRLTALREARRVLRRGAPLFVAAISRFASLMDGVMRGLIDDPAFPPIMLRDLDEGQTC